MVVHIWQQKGLISSPPSSARRWGSHRSRWWWRQSSLQCWLGWCSIWREDIILKHDQLQPTFLLTKHSKRQRNKWKISRNQIPLCSFLWQDEQEWPRRRCRWWSWWSICTRWTGWMAWWSLSMSRQLLDFSRRKYWLSPVEEEWNLLLLFLCKRLWRKLLPHQPLHQGCPSPLHSKIHSEQDQKLPKIKPYQIKPLTLSILPQPPSLENWRV